MGEQTVAAAIDIGGTKTLVGIISSMGEILLQKRFATVRKSARQQLEQCIETVQESLSTLGLKGHDIQGIGVTVPGLAHPGSGKLVHAPFLGWKDIPIRERLSRVWPGMPIEVANDVNACALGELMFGKGKNFQQLLWVTVSTGIGCGLIINGSIFEGETFIAGEIGHAIVEWNGGCPCSCGAAGCLEAHASGTAITRMALDQMAQEGEQSPLSMYMAHHNLEVNAQTVAEAARAGVSEAAEIYKQAGHYLGRALSSAINLLNPGCIVIGGGVSLSFDLLETSIRKVIQTAVIGDANRSIPIVRTALGYEAGMIGAASLVFHHMGKKENVQ